MASIDWRFIQPLDQANSIAAMGAGNQQINAGLAAMQQSVGGLADAFKDRNTNQIMNALYAAQNSAQLPDAMTAVQALQQQFGRGYDQTAVRNAIDTRGSTLGARDLQNINLQQAQAAQAAIPQLNQAAATMAGNRQGISDQQRAAINSLASLGIDASSAINSMGNTGVNDFRDIRDNTFKVEKDTRDFNYRKERDQIGDSQWAEGNKRANISAAASLAKEFETPASTQYSVDAKGNITTTSTSGVKFADALPAIMGSIFNTESGNVHRNSKGELTRSPVGALGVAQIMPATAAKPGYGMKPINLQTSSADEQKAWATEYIGKIQKKHNFTTEQAVAAYNAGAGSVEKAIKDGGSNWLSKLPKETRDYVPKVMGGAKQGGSTSIGSTTGIPQAAMSKVSSTYQDTMAKLNAEFGAQTAKDQVKGSLATTGKNVDTWAAGKKDTGMLFSSNNSFFTKAGDLAKMAKKDPTFAKLPENAQINVLEGAYAKMNDVNAFQYVPDGDLQKFISRESANYQKDRVNQFNQAKASAMEQAYQNTVQAFQAAGSRPPNRESVMQMLDPQYKPAAKPAQPKPQPVQTQAQKATEAVKSGVPALLSNAPNQRAQAVQQGKERATSVANMPTADAMKAMRAQALAKANTAKQKEDARKAFDKLEEEKKKKKLSPETRKLLEQFGGGLLK